MTRARLLCDDDEAPECDELPSAGRNKVLDRSEFVHCLVRAAVMVYVLPGTHTDVSSAVESFFCEWLRPRAEAHLLRSADDHRAAIIYTEVRPMSPNEPQ